MGYSNLQLETGLPVRAKALFASFQGALREKSDEHNGRTHAGLARSGYTEFRFPAFLSVRCCLGRHCNGRLGDDAIGQ
jgi:hypothetical protein